MKVLFKQICLEMVTLLDKKRSETLLKHWFCWSTNIQKYSVNLNYLFEHFRIVNKILYCQGEGISPRQRVEVEIQFRFHL